MAICGSLDDLNGIICARYGRAPVITALVSQSGLEGPSLALSRSFHRHRLHETALIRQPCIKAPLWSWMNQLIAHRSRNGAVGLVAMAHDSVLCSSSALRKTIGGSNEGAMFESGRLTSYAHPGKAVEATKQRVLVDQSKGRACIPNGSFREERDIMVAPPAGLPILTAHHACRPPPGCGWVAMGGEHSSSLALSGSLTIT